MLASACRRCPKNVVRPPDILEDAMREVVGQLLAVDADLQDRELVAAEPPDDVAGAQAVLEPVGDALQQAVAHQMAVLVVDLLEVIEIDPVQRKAQPWIVALELLLEALAEVEAVGDLRSACRGAPATRSSRRIAAGR